MSRTTSSAARGARFAAVLAHAGAFCLALFCPHAAAADIPGSHDLLPAGGAPPGSPPELGRLVLHALLVPGSVGLAVAVLAILARRRRAAEAPVEAPIAPATRAPRSTRIAEPILFAFLAAAPLLASIAIVAKSPSDSPPLTLSALGLGLVALMVSAWRRAPARTLLAVPGLFLATMLCLGALAAEEGYAGRIAEHGATARDRAEALATAFGYAKDAFVQGAAVGAVILLATAVLLGAGARDAVTGGGARRIVGIVAGVASIAAIAAAGLRALGGARLPIAASCVPAALGVLAVTWRPGAPQDAPAERAQTAGRVLAAGAVAVGSVLAAAVTAGLRATYVGAYKEPLGVIKSNAAVVYDGLQTDLAWGCLLVAPVVVASACIVRRRDLAASLRSIPLGAVLSLACVLAVLSAMITSARVMLREIAAVEAPPPPEPSRAPSAASAAAREEAPPSRLDPPKLTIRSGDHHVRSLAFSPKGDLLIGGENDGTITAWDVATGREVRRFRAGTYQVHRVAVSADGARVVSADWDGVLRVHQLATGKELSKAEVHRSPVLGFDVAPGSSARAVFGNVVWDLGRNVKIAEVEPIRATSAVFLGEGRVVTGDQNPSSDGGDERPCSLDVFDAASGRRVSTLEPRGECVWHLAMSRDGKRLAALTKDRALRVWDGGATAETTSLALDAGEVYAVALLANGAIAATAGTSLCLWDLSGSGPRRIECRQEKDALGGSFVVSPDDRLAAASAGGGVNVYALPERPTMAAWAQGAPVLPRVKAPVLHEKPKPAYASTAKWTQRDPAPPPRSPVPASNVSLLASDAAGLRIEAVRGDYAYSAMKSERAGILRTPIRGGASEAVVLGEDIEVDSIVASADRLYWLDRPTDHAAKPSARPARIATMPIGGGAIEVLAHQPTQASGLVLAGDRLAWCTHQDSDWDRGTKKWVEAVPGLWTLPLAGGAPARVWDEDLSYHCAAVVGDELLLASGRDLVRLPVHVGAPRREALGLENPLGKNPNPYVFSIAPFDGGLVFIAHWHGVATFYAREIVQRSGSGANRSLLPVAGHTEPFALVVDGGGLLVAIADDDRMKKKADKKDRLERLGKDGARAGVLVGDMAARGQVAMQGSDAGAIWSDDGGGEKGALWLLRPGARPAP